MARAADSSPARQLAALLRAERPALLARWRALVLADPAIVRANEVREPILIDHLPELIDGLAATLEAVSERGGGEQGKALGRSGTARAHARLRVAAGYSLAEALLELSCLRLAILELAVGAGLTISWETGLTIHHAIDRAMATLADELGRLQNQMLTAVVEPSGDGVIMADQDGRLRLVNAEAQRQHGIGLQDIPATEWATAFGLRHPDGRPMTTADVPLFRALQGETVHNAFWQVRRPDGAIRYLSGSARPLFLPDGTPMGAVISTRDETDRLAAEAERERLWQSERAAREQVTLILESITEAFFALDRSWHFTYVNHEAERVLQRSREDLLGRLVWEAFPASLNTPFQEHYERAMASGKAEHFEACYAPLATWVGVHAYPSDSGLAVYFVDITDQRAAMAERERLLARERQAREEAEAAVRMRDEVLAVVSHDLRNPLTAIDLNVAVMQTKSLDADQLAKRLAAVRRAAQRAGHLIRDLLDVSRIEDWHALAMDLAPQEVTGLVREVCEMVQPQAAAKLIQVDCQVDPATPAVMADRHRLIQALGNLLDNAVNFSPEGGHIRLAVAPDAAGGVQVAVSDSGPGILPEDQAHLFERFWQARHARRAGAGLGLAIVKGIVEAHHGTLAVESKPGCGATFRITLPAAVPESQAGQAA